MSDSIYGTDLVSCPLWFLGYVYDSVWNHLVWCFHVSLVPDAAYCTIDILTLSHWVHIYVHLHIQQNTNCDDNAFHENSIVPMYHFFRSALYSDSHWGHHYVSSFLYVLISSHFLSLDPIIYSFDIFMSMGMPTSYACLIHIHVTNL